MQNVDFKKLLKTFSLFLVFATFIACGGNKDTKHANKPETNTTISTEGPDTVEATYSETEEEPDQASDETRPDNNQSSFNWAKISGWHTQGLVSRNSPIEITFNRNVIDADQVGKPASKIMHIAPALKGKPVFKTQSSISWVPLEELKAGELYKVSIKPTGLKDVPQNTPPYQYSFRVIPLEYEIKTLGLSSVADKENEMQLKGELLVSDKILPDAVSKILSATSQGKKLPIDWIHNNEGKYHRFTINNIIRETFDTDVTLSWNGASINVDNKGTKEIVVPNINTFNVTRISVLHDQGTNPYVQVLFSDKLDSKQNIKGLVELTKNKYKVDIEGNALNIYPNKNLAGTFDVRLYPGIKGENLNKVLTKKIERKVTFNDAKPQVRFVGKGSILPENTLLEIPFEAVGVSSVDVSAFKIYPDNMGQFLQVSQLSGSSELNRSGRYLWRKTIPLKPADPNKWNRYSFDVTKLLKKHQGGLLRLNLTINRHQSTYPCSAADTAAKHKQQPLKNAEDYGVQEASGWDGISDYYEETNNYNYNWNQRHDPCSASYYRYNTNTTSASKNFITSNIGLIAKQEADGSVHIISTDLRTAKPLTGTEFEIRNYQGQLMASGTSDGSGFAKIPLTSTPFLLIAKKFNDTAYLKLNNKTALAVSHFDVGGKKINKGIKGFIYGERGVWRPGDDIYLTFVLENKNKNNEKAIPEGHPVTMRLYDPQGKLVKSKTSTESVGGFYAFKFKTTEKSQTGNWLVKAFVGGSSFSKSLMIETVRPNRLKIELGFDGQEEVIYSADGESSGTLFAQWLHGATAANLKADISVRFSQKKTRFNKFTDYVFDDPARHLKSQDQQLLQGRLDDQGYLKFSKNLKPEGRPAGLLSAKFTSRVFEDGGAFSISKNRFDYHPYDNYVGIKLPKGDATRGMLLTDKKHSVKIASLSAKSENVSLEKVQLSLYKIKWKWWWDKSSESLAEYADSSHKQLLQQETIKTVDGTGDWQFEIKYPQWGRYLIRACDLEGGHCSGKTVYIDWPGWAGRAQEEGSGAASRLNIFSDKTSYIVGDEATIQIPANITGRALLTLETGSKILQQQWVEFENAPVAIAKPNGKDKQNIAKVQLKIPITEDMAPNVYVHISMLQPHQGKTNDRPIRLYGIIPLEVKNSKSYLLPVIEAKNDWKPETKNTIKISEENGRPFNYTLAIVDEGLLGLTSFKTPDIHKHFYSKESLGIKTWDLFDHVVGAYSGKLERMLALGGGDEAEIDDDESKKRRFPPVVQFLGPFSLNAGETAEHEVQLPPYLGAVRIMAVTGQDGAYGKNQKSVFIRQPLMLQASLPRVLGPNEEVSVPVTLFAMDDAIKDVTIAVETDQLVDPLDSQAQTVSFSEMGEKVAFVKLKTKNQIGNTQIKITATSTDNPEHQSEALINLDIRRANQATTRTISKVIEPDQVWDNQAQAFGIKGSNSSVLEISSVPPLNLERRLDYLLRYPHGCLEQTTSSAFPQLYLSNLTTLSKKQQQDSEYHVQKAIEKIKRFQVGNGDFAYWPGGNHKNHWSSIYTGHFLLEAKKSGYQVPVNVLNDWLDYQISAAQSFTTGSENNTHTQAYRLYVLALAGKAQIGAMNRLRESSKSNNKLLNNKARWLLASAYQAAAQKEAAQSLIQGIIPKAETSDRPDKSFSSTLGNLGLQLESLVALDNKQDANQILEKIAEEMNSDSYQSTHGIAWALMSVSRYLGGDTSSFTALLMQDGSTTEINSDKAVSRTKLLNPDSKYSLRNTSAIKLFANLSSRGMPAAGDEINQTNNLELRVRMEARDKNNPKVWNELDGNNIPQGTDVRLSVSVENNNKYDAENIALTIPMAAGFEVLSTTEQLQNDNKFDYRDLRDDRIHYYFALKKGEVKTFSLTGNAAYKGRYYQPAIHAEAMYDGNMKALQKGRWITIVK